MCIRRLPDQRPRTGGEFVRDRDDLPAMIERGRDDVDDLPQRQRFGVAAVVDLTGCGVGTIDSEQNRVRDVLGITAVMQRQAAVGQHDVRAPIAYASNDAPLARHELIRPVDERIAEVRRGRMVFEHDAFGTKHAIAFLVFGSIGRLGPLFRDRNRQSMRRQHTGIGVTAIRRHAADRDESFGFAAHDFAGAAQPAVRRDGEVEGAARERGFERGAVERIGVNVFDLRGYFGDFVPTRVQDRHRVTASQQAVDDEVTGGPGTADDETLQVGSSQVDWRRIERNVSCASPPTRRSDRRRRRARSSASRDSDRR